MDKVIRCTDVGFDCNGVIRAPTEDQAPDMLAKVKRAMHDDPSAKR